MPHLIKVQDNTNIMMSYLFQSLNDIAHEIHQTSSSNIEYHLNRQMQTNNDRCQTMLYFCYIIAVQGKKPIEINEPIRIR